MQTSVEVRYAGVVVGRADEVKKGDTSGMGLFLRLPEPMPVGTTVELRAEGSDTQAVVQRVVESAEATASGMFVRLLDANAAWAIAVATSPEEEAVPSPMLVDLSRSEEIRLGERSRKLTPAATDVPVRTATPVATPVAAAPPPADVPMEIPSALGGPAPTVAPGGAAIPTGGPAIPPAIAAAAGRKTLLYYGSDAPAEPTAAVTPDDSKTEQLPPARALPSPARRTGKQRRRK